MSCALCSISPVLRVVVVGGREQFLISWIFEERETVGAG